MKTPDDYLDVNTPMQQPQKRRSRVREREGGREGARGEGEREVHVRVCMHAPTPLRDCQYIWVQACVYVVLIEVDICMSIDRDGCMHECLMLEC